MRFDAGANVNKALHKGLKGNFGQCKLALSLRINRKEMKKGAEANNGQQLR